MLASRGTHLSILECDVLDWDFVSRSVAIFKGEQARFIVGSKRHKDAVDQRPFKRRVLTALYNLAFLRLCFGYPGTDTHGLKSIETTCAKQLCHAAITTDEVFQTEIVLLSVAHGNPHRGNSHSDSRSEKHPCLHSQARAQGTGHSSRAQAVPPQILRAGNVVSTSRSRWASGHPRSGTTWQVLRLLSDGRYLITGIAGFIGSSFSLRPFRTRRRGPWCRQSVLRQARQSTQPCAPR